MKPTKSMTLQECYQEEKHMAPKFDLLVAERDEAEARLDSYLQRRSKINERIIELLEEKQKHG